jgi:methyl-accepting chemotaxis protein
VNTAVAEMDKVVQQNAANAEESSSASEEMNAQENQVKAMVGELIALVGGKKADHANEARQSKMEMPPTTLRNLSPSNASKIGKSERLAVHQGQEVDPKTLIKFDEDEFNDF